MKKLDTKKRTIIALTLIMILIIGISLVLINNNTNKNDLVSNNPNKKQITNSFLTLMLEQEDGTYQESTSNTWQVEIMHLMSL